MRSIVRRDTADTYTEFLKRLAKASGIDTPTARTWRNSIGNGRRKTSNKDCPNPPRVVRRGLGAAPGVTLGTPGRHRIVRLEHDLTTGAPPLGDFDGNGRSDLAVFTPSTATWHVRGQTPVQFGQAGDIPVAADYTGAWVSDLAVYRPLTGTWLVRHQAPHPVR